MQNDVGDDSIRRILTTHTQCAYLMQLITMVFAGGQFQLRFGRTIHFFYPLTDPQREDD